jgi:geranyl-CoA carboxylase alpha subunit
MPAFDTLLIANRGEIAARVIRTARNLGLRTVAVFSEPDAMGLAVALADEAVCIGPALASASYLNVDAILAAAKRTGAQAIHPGYGFLSENAGFARAVEAAGLVWVGPPPDAIEVMGDKARAKARAIAAGVPTVPGFQGSQDPERLAAEAARIGYPVLLKAVAGGGGRGMRRVDRPEQLADAIAGATTEARNAFANGELMLEKLVEHARHVEIQVFADRHGHVIHLGERDCSAQRRHQKIIEEAPSPAVSPDVRARMGAAAVAAAAAIGYVGAGTVEFLLDANREDFYFLEMNTRLQVEHPVTEAITGFDLVAWQLDVAAGATLPITQDQLVLQGHAIEVRFYAEDPAAGFLPQTGEVLAWLPDAREGLRIDHGLRVGVGQGQRIGADYDPMVAKVIAHGATREQARRRLIAGLRSTVLLGPTTNKKFLVDLLAHPAFVGGEVTTNFVEHDASARELGRLPSEPEPELVALAGLLWLEASRERSHEQPGMPSAWTNSHATRALLELRCGAKPWTIAADQRGSGWQLHVGASSFAMRVLASPEAERGAQVRYECDARQRTAAFAWTEQGELLLELDAITWTFAEHRPHEGSAAAEGSDGVIRAPTMGRVLAVAVTLGQRVEAGARLLTLEAMKIESTVLAPIAGTIAELRVAPGDQVDKRALLVTITPESKP